MGCARNKKPAVGTEFDDRSSERKEANPGTVVVEFAEICYRTFRITE